MYFTGLAGTKMLKLLYHYSYLKVHKHSIALELTAAVAVLNDAHHSMVVT